MSSLQSQIESLLFIAIKPLSFKALQDKTTAKNKEMIEKAVLALEEKYNQEGSGINIQRIGEKVQMVTSSENTEMISDYVKDETTGDLTPASLETLTIIAYRGPVSKSEIELIRGVICTLILRNLLMRGLIEEKKDDSGLISLYSITFEFLKYLGINSVEELPDFKELNADENLQNLLHPEEVQESQKEEVSDTSKLK